MRITHAVAVACYWTGVDAIFYWLNKKAKRIVTFHNVLPRELWHPGANGVSCDLDGFEKVVDLCARKFRGVLARAPGRHLGRGARRSVRRLELRQCRLESHFALLPAAH